MTFCGELEMQTSSVFSDLYRLPNKLALMGLRPGFFVPCTLVRTLRHPSSVVNDQGLKRRAIGFG
jgi:hypothetical protein